MMLSPLQHGHRDLQFLPGGLVQGPSSIFFSRLGDELQSLCADGQLDRAIDVLFCMDHKGGAPSVNIYRSLLKACTKRKDLTQAKRIHAHLAQHGLESAKVIGEDLVHTFVKCGALEDALQVFSKLPHRNVFCWTAVISGHVTAGRGWEALRMYQRMQMEQVQPNAFTFVNLLKACGIIPSLEEAKRIHADAVRHGCGSNLFVGSCMVDMYRKCGSIGGAENVFHGLSKRDVVVWTTMLMAYLEQSKPEKAVEAYEQMQVDGVSPNDRTFVSVVQACRMLAESEREILIHGRPMKMGALEKGRAVHADACRKACASDVFVGSSLISMYGKCGNIEDALNAFHGILHPDVVSWNAMLAAYVEQGHAEMALQFYERMLRKGPSPDAWTFVGALQACGMVADKEEGVILDGQTIKPRSLEKGKEIHADVCKKACSSDVLVCNSLLSLYAKCGKIVDAQNLFDGMSRRDVVSWNTMLTAYVQLGQGEKALQLYSQMQEGTVSPDGRTFVSTLQACSMIAAKEQDAKVDGQSIKVKSLQAGEAIHADIYMMHCNSNVYVGNQLIDMYGKCGSVAHAQAVFSGLVSQRDLVSWNVMLHMYVEHGQPIVALEHYEQMQVEGCSPDNRSFVSAIQACSILAVEEGPVCVDGRFTKVKALSKGREVHAAAQLKGYEADAITGCTLIKMYQKCGSIADARKVFDGVYQRNLVAWNLMLAAYVEEDQPEKVLELYQQMHDEGLDPDNRTIVSMLQACGMLMGKEADKLVAGSTKRQSLELVETIHADIMRKGYDTDVYVGNTLVSMYGKCGNILSAQEAFNGLTVRDVVTWNALLTAYIEQGQGEKVLHLYEQMRNEGISPSSRVYVSTLQACCMLAGSEQVVLVGEQLIKVKCLATGKVLHAEIRRKSLDSDVFVSNVLISTYRKCGSMSDAWNVFHRLLERDVVSWNAMLAASVEQGEAENALQLYKEMQEEGVSPDNRTFVSAVQACGLLATKEEYVLLDSWPRKFKSLAMGAAIHSHSWSKGYVSNVFVGNTLVSMYGKCGSIPHAQVVFHELSQRDVVSWNAMLAAYVEQGEADQAVHLYEQMLEEWVSPDNRTLVCTLQACCLLADKEGTVSLDGRPTKVQSLVRGRALHSKVCNMGCDSDAYVGNTLVSMYGKCGSCADAQIVFDGLSVKNLVSWNVMLAAYVEQSQSEIALQLYTQMQQECITQNEVTVVCVLQACSNTGNLSTLRQLHQNLVSSGNSLTPLLGNTLISAYGRCASKVDAQTAFNALSQPDAVSWNALIAAYARAGDCYASIQCYERMQVQGVQPDKVTFICLLSACSHAGLVEQGWEYFHSMSREHGIPPEIEHYVSLADLLGRAGCFTSIEELMSTMPMQPTMEMLLCLLAAYQRRGEVALAEPIFLCAVELDPHHAASYVLMSNTYKDACLLDRAQELTKMRRKQVPWKKPGLSWIEHSLEVHTFVVQDRKHPQHVELYELLTKAARPKQSTNFVNSSCISLAI